MKQYYLRVPIFLAFLTLIFYLPVPLYSQCLCANGDVPITVTQQITQTIRPVDDSTNFIFNKFDPSVGQLMCVDVFTYITGIVRMRLENDEIYPINYRINYNRTDQIVGPGLSSALNNSLTKNYGPYNLIGSDGNPFSGPDYISIGPDSILKSKYIARNVSNVVPFLGIGTLSYFYKLTGKTTVTGSVNYIFSVSSQDNVTVGITYNYCPTTLLAMGLKEFSAIKKSRQDAQLSWTTVNETLGNRYEIEVSSNSANFRSIGTLQSRTVEGSTSSRYEFPYHIDQSENKLYFRVKQVTATGQIAYSPVRFINFEENRKGGFAVYPNPAVNRISMQFDKMLKGDYSIELVNIAGQTIYNRLVSINNSNIIQLELSNPPASGVYYLRARDLGSNEVYSGKLILQHK